MSLPAGNKLGPYENQSPLGRAGCAKCTARDTRLNPITPGLSATLTLELLQGCSSLGKKRPTPTILS
jgi:hypothetical protein